METNSKYPKFYERDITSLIISQKEKWPLFEKNINIVCDTLLERSKEFYIDASLWQIICYNLSYRTASATADVDKALAGERPCFLCRENRPAEQDSIIIDGFELLVNPYPVYLHHLTIPAIEHRPQLITPEAIRQMTRLTRILPDMIIFYNGPRCGASAPDHFHFQAIQKMCATNMEVRSKLIGVDPLISVGKSTLRIFYRDLAPFTYLHIIARNDTELLALFKRAWGALPPADPEPMVNLLAWKSRHGTEMVIVPRAAHRPSCYGSGPGQFLTSPACVEMLGVFPLAMQEDFERFTPEVVQSIYDDVCLNEDETEILYDKLKS